VAPHRRGRTGRHRVGESSASKEGSDEPALANQEILSTRDHPYYSVSRRTWIDADRLKPGELLRADDGSLLEVVEVRWWAENAKTYNFEVEDWHSYFVSEAKGKPGIWVHNGPDPFFWQEGEFLARARVNELPGGGRALQMELKLKINWTHPVTGATHAQRASVGGREMFQRIVSHFQGDFDRIRATWTGKLPDNLDSFNRAVQQGLPEDVAARRTFTGKMAAEHNMRRVHFVQRLGPEGARRGVQVDFKLRRGCGG
tara:strand:- start:5201 stop:5971 length:771 start_codon:yes stop_codon:yes gene_type:complete